MIKLRKLSLSVGKLIQRNLALSLICLAYLIATLMLLVGISRVSWLLIASKALEFILCPSQRSKLLYIPYLTLDIVFLVATLVFGFVGVFYGLMIAYISLVFFALKIYLSVSVFDLFNHEILQGNSPASTQNGFHEPLEEEEEHISLASLSKFGSLSPVPEAV